MPFKFLPFLSLKHPCHLCLHVTMIEIRESWQSWHLSIHWVDVPETLSSYYYTNQWSVKVISNNQLLTVNWKQSIYNLVA